MTTSDDAELQQGLSFLEANRFAEAYRILRPLADAGSQKAQSSLGSMVMLGMHRFSDLAAYKHWCNTASDDQFAAYHAEHGQEDRELSTVWLQAASDGGDGGASHNLAMMYVTGIGEEGWEERKQKALALLAKSRAQGFLFLNDGEPPGVAYLEFMERCAALHKRHAARQSDKAQSDQP